MLSEAECERARQARDARFDGRFFIGVRTTGVYCRPVCKVRIPMAKNVQFFPSAAAASAAGFRPCLRCRPEAAPGSPAWRGSEVTVRRALRLIDEGALDRSHEGGATVAALSARLGIGARHLSRLFKEHVGASPIAVAQTRRLLFAKKLIDETDLSMTDVAMSAGFGSVRRFNALLRSTYGRSPLELRRSRRRRRSEDGRIVLRLSYRPPRDLSQVFRFFAAHSIDGLEDASASGFKRSARIGSGATVVDVRPTDGEVELAVGPHAASALMDIVARVRELFDLNANAAAVADHLESDPRSARLLRAHGVPRVPGGWDPFELTVRTIVGQGVSVAAARRFGARLVSRFGEPFECDNPRLTHLFPTAEALTGADLTEIGITTARAAAIRAVASGVHGGAIDFDASDCEEALGDIAGVGPWTVSYVRLRGFGEPDAFPAEDLVLRRMLAVKTSRDANRIAECWRPWRGYAAMLLWQQAAG